MLFRSGDVMNVEGHEHHFVVTLEGYPMLSDTEARIRKSGAERVVLCPLMFVAGDHAKNDIAGEMKEQLEAKGYQVETISVYGGEGMRAIEPAYPGEYFVKTDPVVYRATIEPEKK